MYSYIDHLYIGWLVYIVNWYRKAHTELNVVQSSRPSVCDKLDASICICELPQVGLPLRADKKSITLIRGGEGRYV